jgi:hypothetical protein
MKLLEATEQVKELIREDSIASPMDTHIDFVSPDRDPGKFVILGEAARVIQPFDGFKAKINKNWFSGSDEPPKIKGTLFYWYVFAVGSPSRVKSYFVCNYQQVREWVLEFEGPMGNDHRDHEDWRGVIEFEEGDSTGYFRWGDEDKDDFQDTRPVKLRNIRELVDGQEAVDRSTTERYQLPTVPQPLLSHDNPIHDIQNYKHTYESLAETARETVVLSRVGQGLFRRLLMDYWGSCSVTGCDYEDMLLASHIKPWRDSTNRERLDPDNGLLLIPNLDTAFDRGLIGFSDAGLVMISKSFDIDSLLRLGISPSMRITRELTTEQKGYLAFHRENILLD